MIDAEQIRRIFREELELAFKEVRIARQARSALLRADHASIFRICHGSLNRKSQKIWDSVDAMSIDPFEAIVAAIEKE
ncbi:hypothetical protein M0R72_10680 [Candidatus Pacearchaeota archaeon]|jgi:hypothetical protein|nr:hypothetical protein [Candidatus Pacearchaeota archaeon]